MMINKYKRENNIYSIYKVTHNEKGLKRCQRKEANSHISRQTNKQNQEGVSSNDDKC